MAKPTEEEVAAQEAWDKFEAAVIEKCKSQGRVYDKVSYPSPKKRTIDAEWPISVVDGPINY